MPLEHPNITLGTAGHIDHGKTALVKFLTGCDTDRLKEEKERGMSIDLGFAPCTLANMQVGIVDVPGHEHFVKTMVAGASGMDGVIFVVAADDGVMPQTREHLEILTLLGVKHGVVALTKMDRVSPEELEITQEDVRSFLRGTFLESAPILPICNLTGEGYEAFYEALVSLVRSIEPKRTDGVFRLPVERAFSAKGYGTVVAGIPVSGSARVGDEVLLLPGEVTGRIKGAEVYGQPSDAVLAGQCAALNVRHWEHKAIKRGDVVTAPGYFAPQEWYVCSMQFLLHERLLLKSGERVKFHTGTSEVTAAAYLLDRDQARGGDECLVQCRMSDALVAGPGDRFIIRTLSPVRTIGGGMVVEAVPKRLKRAHPGLVQDLSERAHAVRNERDFVEYCIRKAPGLAADEAALSVRAKLPAALVHRIAGDLVRDGQALRLAPDLYVHAQSITAERARVLAVVAEYHRSAPQSPGIAREGLLRAAQLPEVVFNCLIGSLKDEGALVERQGRLALAGHSVAFSDEDDRLLDALESAFREAAFHPPDVEDAARRAGIPDERAAWALKTLLEHGRLVEVAEGLVFHSEAVQRAQAALVSYIRKEGKLESVKFKYVLDTTRKYAIPLLDYFDRIGVTSRVGNTRHLKGPGGAGMRA